MKRLFYDPDVQERAEAIFAATVYRACREARLRELGKLDCPEPTAEEWDIYRRASKRLPAEPQLGALRLLESAVASRTATETANPSTDPTD